MDPEEKKLLEKTLKLSEENNQILRKMQRATRLAFAWGLIKILIIIVPIVVGYLYLEPRLGALKKEIDQIRSVVPTIEGLSDYMPR